MYWRKIGRIYSPPAQSWMHSYAQVPTPLICDGYLRIYFGCRPEQPPATLPVSQISYVDVDIQDPMRVLRVADRAVLELGEKGCFDEFGLHPICAVRRDEEIWLYYVGWTRMVSVPFNRAIGLAVSRDGGETFSRLGRGPILGPTLNEPFLQQGPVVKEFRGLWHMWYLSGTEWIENKGRMEAIYQMMHATSKDGVAWERDGKRIMPTVQEYECHAGQALLQIDEDYHMWFSFRRGLDFRNKEGGYRIGHAVSRDLVVWNRDDTKTGISLSDSGWDSEMICYPSIVECGGRSLLFYSGNYFGRGGFGFAELVTDVKTTC